MIRIIHCPARSSLGPSRYRRGFTLIELLVVVAIIALLVAILLPSLARVRIQAKIVTDKANAKQIAISVASYQAEARGFVPIIYNWHAVQAAFYNTPARIGYLSLALRRYEKGLSNVSKISADSGGTFDPDEPWSVAKRDEYEARLLPEHYICPFVRGKEPWDLRQVGVASPMELWEWSGIMESYHTGMWEDVIRNEQALGEPTGWGGSPLNGTPKYSVLTWNQITATGLPPSNPRVQNELHRQWTDADARRLKSSSLGSLTVLYCAIGEHVETGNRWVDRGNHRTSQGGGSTVVFADSHVGWVKGTRVGWP